MTGNSVFGDLRARNRSVDEISTYGDGTMNVWQTLEVISGNNLRKKYHYEGYSDVDNVLRTLTTSSRRRDSFVDKINSPEESKRNDYGDGTECEKLQGREQGNFDAADAAKSSVSGKKKRGRGRSVKSKKKLLKLPPLTQAEENDMIVLSLECTDLVKCSFNIPRLSAKFERLMGTNVIRLTDRKYMEDLRQRIDEDYRYQLSSRIRTREIKELERERRLILDGKTDSIPEELSDDPIFVAHRRANIEIVKRRSKLKTNREKYGERLLRQGLKWEAQRLIHDEQVRLKQTEYKRVKKERQALVDRYAEEDAQLGLDLLRIKGSEWQDCEKDLVAFLKDQRDLMKERSRRVPTPYSSDPQDIVNIVRARKKFRETEKKIRSELEKKKQSVPKRSESVGGKSKTARSASLLYKSYDDVLDNRSLPDSERLTNEEISPRQQVVTVDDIKRQKKEEMERQIENECQRGYIVTTKQFADLRYSDAQIAQLKDAKNIRELYRIAEKIITGKPDEPVITEEMEGLEEEEED